MLGLLLGLGIAKGMSAFFAAMGVDLPKSGTVLATRTIIVSMLTGTLVTLVASIVPALRATRVPPISAVREGSTATPSGGSGRKPYAATHHHRHRARVCSGSACSAASPAASSRCRSASACSMLFVGIAMLAPRLVKPIASLVGLPAAKLGGSAGRLARENSVRNPGRTASTAAALMIGLALVTVVATLGAGLRSSTESSVKKQVNADYVVTAKEGGGAFPAASDKAVAAADGRRGSPRASARTRPRWPARSRRSAASTPRRSTTSTTTSGRRARSPAWTTTARS